MSTDSSKIYTSAEELNKDQRGINPDPRYWTWFEQWWAQDFSWEGLAKREIEGWDDGRTLQDYWREEEDKLIPFGKDQVGKLRQWTILHQPPHDLDGKTSWKHAFRKKTWKDGRWEEWLGKISIKLKDASVYQADYPDRRAQLTGVFLNMHYLATA